MINTNQPDQHEQRTSIERKNRSQRKATAMNTKNGKLNFKTGSRDQRKRDLMRMRGKKRKRHSKPRRAKGELNGIQNEQRGKGGGKSKRKKRGGSGR